MRDGKSCRWGLVGRLNDEWDELVESSGDVIARWAAGHPALAGIGSLADVLARLDTDSDPVLAALLREGRSGCRVAPRAVLQALLGRMARMAARDPNAGVDDYVATLWCVICRYPLEARPASIAANLALDTLKAVRREGRWVIRGEVTPWPPDEHLDDIVTARMAAERLDYGRVAAEISADRLLDVAEALGVLSPGVRVVLRTVYCDGLSGEQAAKRLGLSPTVVRQRCSRGARRLTENAVALVEAA